MSGGHWDYRQFSITNTLMDVGRDGDIVLRFPKVAQIFRDLSVLIGDTIHALDWDLSGDSLIKDDSALESDFVANLGNVIDKKFTLKVYEIEESNE